MERYDVKDQFHAWYEHWHRYHWISSFVANKVVADLACGEGYGSALLSQSAKQVIGADIDTETIASAQKKYHDLNNLLYLNADVLDSKIDENSIDVVVSFETLEHLDEHDLLLNEFKRILSESGVLVLSTPDKAVYSGNETHNEFHIKELYEKEFRQLVENHFSHVIYFGQQFQTTSMLARLDEGADFGNSETIFLQQGNEMKAVRNSNKPTYLIAIASDSKEAIEVFNSKISYMNDNQNSLFKHYEKQIQQFMKVDNRLIELEKQLDLKNQIISQLQARLGL